MKSGSAAIPRGIPKFWLKAYRWGFARSLFVLHAQLADPREAGRIWFLCCVSRSTFKNSSFRRRYQDPRLPSPLPSQVAQAGRSGGSQGQVAVAGRSCRSHGQVAVACRTGRSQWRGVGKHTDTHKHTHTSTQTHTVGLLEVSILTRLAGYYYYYCYDDYSPSALLPPPPVVTLQAGSGGY